jgi:cell division transport system ATP-binding protein
MCFITGPSGSGKTTLLRILYRETLPTHGQVRIGDAAVLRLPDSRIYGLRRTMGVVFQDFRLLPRRRVFENVALALRVQGTPGKELKRKVFIALRMVNLHHRIWDYPEDLSYGEQQRVAIARAVVNNPPILLADEPTGNLDPDLATEIMSLFQEIHRQGTTVLVCTHDRDLIRRFPGRVFALQEGKLLGRGAP